jgi:triosephosphate isomerase (TIM)
MRQLIAGNWKMNGLGASLSEIEAIGAAVEKKPPHADILICPPSTLISRAVDAARNRVPIGGQNCHAEVSGAFTGEVSAEMLRDAGARAVIVGHSERRQYFGETDAQVAAKAKAGWRAGLFSIVCIGEIESERDAGQAAKVCSRQVRESVPAGADGNTTAVAYEPVWAIGTGRTPTNAQIAEIHAEIRAVLVEKLGEAGKKIRILYGGSVKPSNAAEILAIPEVGGALVGGASLKASDFLAIVTAVPAKS